MAATTDNPWEMPPVQIVDWDPDARFLQLRDPYETPNEDTSMSMIGPCDLLSWI